MKITLSKSQWQFIGKQTGWIKLAETKEELITTLNQMWQNKSSPDYASLKSRIENNEFKSKFHLINSIKKRIITPTKPKSKFEPELKAVHKPGIFGTFYQSQPLPPELENEAKKQRIEMTNALVEQAGLQKSTEDMPDVNPWGKNKDYYNPEKNKNVIMKGVIEGKWDEYLAKEMLEKMKKNFDLLIR
jgi:hypothetical protein